MYDKNIVLVKLFDQEVTFKYTVNQCSQ